MRIVIIGAVAAGTSAAAKARRNTEQAEIVIYEKDTFISYSGCGMPYYIGGEVKDVHELTPRDPAFFKKKYNVDVYIGHEVLGIEPSTKKVQVKNLNTGEVFNDSYDKLIVATGATAFEPQIDGISNSNVFKLRNINDVNKIKDFVTNRKPKSAVIVGSGYIGLEVCENLSSLGVAVTVVEKLR